MPNLSSFDRINEPKTRWTLRNIYSGTGLPAATFNIVIKGKQVMESDSSYA